MTVVTRRATVIIPTYNRPDNLKRTLQSISTQTLALDEFELLVVDDGSSANLNELINTSWPFHIQWLHQTNLGATVARNNGAQQSSGRVLIFIDDDISPYPNALECIVNEIERCSHSIVLGTLTNGNVGQCWESPQEKQDEGEVPFTLCLTGLLAIRREDFELLGHFQDPTGGWPNWDDVDFGYRAHLAGFKLIRLGNAKAIHWDLAASDFRVACARIYNASVSAARLFERHPQLFDYIPMFHDKSPINSRKDSPRLIVRKIARKISSTTPVLYLLETTTSLYEKFFYRSGNLQTLYRWILGGYIFRGYRQGLRENRISQGS